MAQFFQSVGDVLSTLGSSFCVPVMLFIIALFMGCKGQKAFRAALLCAAGLTGFSLVINSYSGIIAPVVQSMVDSTGVKLSCLDVGWQAFSVIAYGTGLVSVLSYRLYYSYVSLQMYLWHQIFGITTHL